MSAVWDIYRIAEMTEEQRVRNRVRQLLQEAGEWNRIFTFRGRAVMSSGGMPKGVWLVLGGVRGRQWAQVNGDDRKYRLFGINHEGAELYAAIMAAAERLACTSS